MNRYLLAILLTISFTILNSIAYSQINNNEFKVTLSPEDLGMCGGTNNSYDTVSIIAKKTGLSSLVVNVGLNTMPGISYVSGSASIISQPSGGSYGLVEDLTNGLTLPSFQISNLSTWNVTDEVIFVFQREASCDAVAFVQSGGILKDQHTIFYDDNGSFKIDGDIDPAVSSYDLLYASLSIQTINTVTTNVGSTVSRDVKVIQGGLGNTSGFTHYVVVGSSLSNYQLSFNANPLTPSSISGDTLFYTIDFSAAPFSGNIGNGDAIFDNGEDVTFVESFIPINCDDIEVDHHSFWGCSLSENCQESSTQGHIVFSEEVPSISATLSSPNNGYFDLCTSKTITVNITNNNTNAGGAALDIALNLGLRHNTSPLSRYDYNPMWAFDWRDTKRMSNFMYNCSTPIDTTANPSTIYPNNGSGVTIYALKDYFTTDPDGPGVGLDDLDGDGFFDDLVPGGTFQFCFDMEMNLRDRVCGVNRADYFLWEHVSLDILHRDQCLNPRVTVRREINYSNMIRDYLYTTLLNAPSDVQDGDNFDLEIKPGLYFGGGIQCNGASATSGPDVSWKVKIILPAGITLQAGATPNLGGSYNPTLTMSGDTAIYEVDQFVNRVGENYIFPLTLNCANYTGGSNLSIPYITTYQCGSCIKEDIHCGNFNLVAHCGVSCTGPTILDFDSKRSSAGWTDETMTTKVDLSTLPSQQLDIYLAKDSMEIDVVGYINGGANLNNLYFDIDYEPGQNNPIIDFISGEIEIVDNITGSSAGTITVAPVLTNPSSGVYKVRFDLSSYTSLVSGAYQFGASDSINLKLKYRLRSNFGGSTYYNFSSFRGKFFTIDAGTEIYCDTYGDNVKYLRVTWGGGNSSNYGGIMRGCVNAAPAHFWSHYSYTSDIHPFEYRPPTQWDSTVITLNPVLEFDGEGSWRTHDVGYKTWYSTNGDIDMNIDQSTNTLVMSPTGNYYDGDQTSLTYDRFAPLIHGTCEAPSEENNISWTWDRYIKDFKYSDDPVTYVQTYTMNYRYYPPDFLIQPLNPISYGTEATTFWDVEICATTDDIDYNWIQVEPNFSGITIIDAATISGGVETSANFTQIGGYTWVEAGNIDNGDCKIVRVYANFTNCASTELKVEHAWSCSGYPNWLNQRDCYKDTITLELLNNEAELQLSVVNQPTTSVTMCDPFNLELELNSSQVADLIDPSITFNVPGGASGMTIIQAQVEYPRNSGNIQTVTSSISAAGVATINIMDHTVLTAQSGILGTQNAANNDERNVKLILQLQVECDFIVNSPIIFNAYGKSPCGSDAIGNGINRATDPIAISTVTTPYDMPTEVTFTNLTGELNGCSVQETMKFKSIVIGGTTGIKDSTTIVLPEYITYVTGSFNTSGSNVSVLVSVTQVGNTQELLIGVPNGVSNGDSIVYEFDIETDYTGCNSTADIQVTNWVALPGVYCGPVQCPVIIVNTGAGTGTVNIQKPNPFDSGNSTGSVLLNQTGASEYNINIIVQNTASIAAAIGYEYNIYCSSSNGLPIGASIYNGSFGQVIPANGTITETLAFASANLCSTSDGLVVELVPSSTNCQCDTSYIRVDLIVDFDRDGIPDGIDLDDDNDGIPDLLELNCNAEQGNFTPQPTNADLSAVFTLNDGTTGFISSGGTFSSGRPIYQNTSLELERGGGSEASGSYSTIAFDIPVYNVLFHLSKISFTDATNNENQEIIGYSNGNAVYPIFSNFQGGADTTGVHNNIVYDAVTLPIVDASIDFTFDAPLDSIRVIARGTQDFIAIELIEACNVDTDGDGLANNLDIDSDNDGITDIIEAGGTDADGDGHVDYPTAGDPTSMTDVDMDGLSDDYDVTEGGTAIPNPDTDGDGLNDFIDIDSDNDGIVDNIEAQTTLGYLAPLGTDTDGDGLDDRYDGDDEQNFGIGGGTGNSVIPNQNDTDGNPDYTDTDSDDDGMLDILEGWDSNGDGVADVTALNSDIDNDGLDDAFDNDDTQINPTNGQVPSDFPNNYIPSTSERDWREFGPDCDMDGVMDPIDLDDDNDGILDIYESDYCNLDTDGDGCSDVNEAGFTDPNGDGILGDLPVVVDSLGRVISGVDGYTVPDDLNGNSVYDFQEASSYPVYTLTENACIGDNVQLTYDNINGATYAWTGPNGFTSNVREPLLTSVSSSDAGVYYLIITVHNCPSDTVSETTVNVSDGAPIAFSSITNPSTCGSSNGSISFNGLDVTHTYKLYLNSANLPVGNQTGISSYTYSMLLAGTYTVQVEDITTGCFSTIIDTSIVDPSSPSVPATIGNNGPICQGGTLNLTTSGAGVGETYNWTGPNGFTSSTQNPSLTTAITGNYCVSITSVFGCTGPDTCTSVVINPLPTIQVINFANPTTCVPGNEGTITINGLTPSTSYDFTITPYSGFTATSTASGAYTFTNVEEGAHFITANQTGLSCTSNTVNQSLVGPSIPAAPVASNNGPLCEDDDLQLQATPVGGASTIYTWTGPCITTSNENNQNPLISNAATTCAGIYQVTASINGCVSNPGQITVVINDTTSLTLISTTDPTTCTPGNDGTVTIGGLTNGVSYTANYASPGPTNFTASGTTHTLTGLSAANFNLSVTNNSTSCSSNSISFTINAATATAAPVVNSNTPVCIGDDINLSTDNITGATYAWTGPNTFTSNQQNPIISSATTAMTGQYCLEITVGGCTSAQSCTDVVINTKPVITLQSASDPTTCTPGDDGTLTIGNLINGQSYQYGGTLTGFITASGTSYTQTGLSAGAYNIFLIDTSTGCTSNSVDTTLSSPDNPIAPIVSSNSPICEGESIELTCATVANATYAWTGPNGYSSSDQNPVIANAVIGTHNGTYNCTITVNGCLSPISSTNVTINAAPTISLVSTMDPSSCIPDPFGGFDGSITIGGLTSGLQYIVSWTGPANGNSGTFTAIGSNYTIIDLEAGSYQVIVTRNNCASNILNVSLSAPGAPNPPSISNDGPKCEGENINFIAGSVSGASYTWTGPGSYFSSNQNPTLSNVTTSNSGIYCLTVTVNGCVSGDTCMNVIVNETPNISVLAFNNPTSCVPGDEGTITIDGLTIDSSYIITYSNGTAQTLSVTATTSSYQISSLVAGNYTISIEGTSSGCQSNTVAQTLTGPTTPSTPSPSNDGPVCVGGDIQFSVSPVGNATYAWTGPNGFSSLDQNPLITDVTIADAGFYQVVITVDGCASAPGQTSVVVNPNSSIIISSVTNPSGCGNPDGSVTISGLTPGTTYNAPVGLVAGTTYTYTGLSAGAFSEFVTVTSSGCISNVVDTSLVDPNAPGAPNANNDGAVCSGTDVQLSTDSIGDSYEWTGPLSYMSTQQNPLLTGTTVSMSGSYCVTVTVNGCTSAATCTEVEIDAVPVISEVSSIDPTTCVPGDDGSITIDGLVGGTTYTLEVNGSISSISPTGNTHELTGLDADTYVINVQTSSGCESNSITVTLSNPATPSAPTISNDGPVCEGEDVQLTASSVLGGSYAWTGPNSYTSTDQNPLLSGVTSMEAGIYSCVVTVAGCESAMAQTTVVVSTSDTISITSVLNPSNCGVSDGSITIDGLAAGTYIVLGGLSSPINVSGATHTFTGLEAGAYTISLENADGCISNVVDTSLVDPNAPGAPNANNDGAVCSGTDVQLSTDSTGDSYEWTGPLSYMSTQQNPLLTGTTVSMSGSYCVTVTVNGCTSAATCTEVEIDAVPVISEVSSIDPTTCVPGDDGSITIDGLVGGTTYTLEVNGSISSISPTGNTHELTGLDADTYVINVQTSSGCESNSITVTLSNPATPSAPTISNDGPVCEGEDVQLTASSVLGGSYAWTGPNSYTSTDQNPLLSGVTSMEAGIYSCVVTVAGCESAMAQTTVVVSTSDTISITSVLNPSNCGVSDGSITIDGLTAGTYIVLGGLSSPINVSGATHTFTGLEAGAYTISLENADGCISNVVDTSLVDPNAPGAPNANNDGAVCSGTDVQLSTDSIGDSYEWTGPLSYMSTQQNPLLTGTTVSMSGSYCVTVTVNGCTSAATCTEVEIDAVPAISEVSSVDPTTCVPGDDGSITIDGLVGGTTYTLEVNGSISSISPTGNTHELTGLDADTYVINVQTSSGCESNSITVTLSNPATPSAPTISNDGPVCEGEDVQLTASSVLGGSYAWTGPNSYTSTDQNPLLSGVTSMEAGIYSCVVTVAGCESAMAQTTVVVSTSDTISITSVLNPSNCGVSDGSITIDGLAAGTYIVLGGLSSPINVSGATHTFTGLEAGAYTISLENADGCISNVVDTSLVDPNAPGAPNANNDGAVCSGTDVQLSTDSIGDSYEWTGPLSYMSTQQNPLLTGTTVSMSGSYCVTVTVNGCTSAATCTEVEIDAVPAISEVSSIDPTTCVPGDDGSITIDGLISGNVYDIDTNGTSFSITASGNTYQMTGLTSGTYVISVETSSGCESNSITVTLSNPATPSAPTISNDGPVCEGEDVQLTASSVLGGSYAWTGPNSYTSTDQNPLLSGVTSMEAGIYSCVVTVAGCESAMAQTTVVVSTSDTISITSVLNPSNCGVSDGSITIDGLTAGTYIVLGGLSSPINVSGATHTFTGLEAGAYTISLENADGCISNVVDTSLVDPNAPGAPNANNDGAVCSGTDVQLSTDSIGDSYEWTGPLSYMSTQQNPLLTGTTVSMSGSYCVTVTVNGCTSAATCTEVEIDAVPAISEVSSVDPTTCVPGDDGSITIDGLISGNVYDIDTNGTSFSITASGNTYQMTGLTSGTYVISVETSSGCESNSITVTLNNPATPSAPTISNDGPACEGEDVQLTASSVAGGTYEWMFGGAVISTMQNPLLSNVSIADAGIYSCVVTVAGCESTTAQITLEVNENPVIFAVDSLNPTNCGVADGTITIGGLLNGDSYSLVVNGTSTSITASGTTHVITTLLAGNYNILLSSSVSCNSNAINISLVDPNGPNTPNINQNGPLCLGDDLILSTDSTNVNYSYEWTGPNGSTLPSFTVTNVALTDGGQYCLTIEEAGCVSTATCINVVVNDVPNAPVVSSPINNACPLVIADLTSAVAPGAGTIVYRTLNDINSPAVADPTAVSAGLYYAFDSLTTCISAGSEIEVVLISCCTIDSIGLDSVTCNDNGTPTDPSDDFLDFQVTVTGSNLGVNGFNIIGTQLANGTVVSGIGNYNIVQNYSTSIGSAGGGNVVLNVVDQDDNFCDIQVTLVDPGNCFDCPEYTIGGFSILANATSCFPGDEGQLQLTGLNGGSDYNIIYDLNGVVNITETADASGNVLITGLGQGNIDYIVVTELPINCVSDTLFGPIIIDGPDLPTITNTVSTSNPSSCGICDGEIVLSGLTPNTQFNVFFDLDGNPQSISNVSSLIDSSITLTGLCEGMYTDFVVVDNSIGCQSSPAYAGNISLTEPVTPVLDSTNVVANNTTGCGVCDGSIVISGLESSTSYSISYSNGTVQTTTGTSTVSGELTIANLCAGNYDDFIFTNTTTNCEYDPISGGPFEIFDPSTLSIGIVAIFSQPTACGTCNGSIMLSGGGIMASTQYNVYYSLNLALDSLVGVFSNASGTINLSNLCIGSYDNFYITDATGCTSPVFAGPFELVEPNSPIIDSVSVVGATNCGMCDGQLVINLDASQMGAAPYDVTYYIGGVSTTINNLALTGSTIVVPNLCEGSYYDISILDNGGCNTLSFAGPFEITDPNELLFGGISDTTNPSGCGICDGTITLTGLTPATSYDVYYVFNGLNQLPATIVSGGTGDVTLTSLCAGLYEDIVIVNTTTNCTSAPVGPVTLEEPTPEMLNASNVVITDPTGCNSCDGILTINGLTVSTNYTVSYFFNGLPNGTISVTTNGAGTFVINSLCEGSYSDIILTNGITGCESPAITGGPFELEDPAAPMYDTTNVSSTNTTACGTCDGSLIISGLPASTSISIDYTLNGVGQTTYTNNTSGTGILTIPSLCSGTYDDIVITDNNSTCVSDVIIGGNIISDPTSLIIGNISITNQPSVCGVCDGIITLSAGGIASNTSYDIEYTLNGVLQTITLFSNVSSEIALSTLCAGQYDNFTVSDATGCTSPVFAGPFDLVEPNSPVIDSIITVDATNCGICDGQLIIHLDPTQLGTAPYDVTYSLAGVATTINNVALTGNTIVIPNLCEGSYYDVSIIDDGACATISQAGPFEIEMPTMLENVIVVTTNDPTLCNVCDGSIVIGGLTQGTYTVFYNTPAISVTGLVASPAGEISLTGLCAGSYTDLYVSNTTSACNSLQLSGSPFVLNDPLGPVLAFADISYTDPTICGVADGTITVSNLIDGNYYIIDYIVDSVNHQSTNAIVAIGGSISFGNLEEANYSNFHLVDTTTGCESNYVLGDFDMIYPNFIISTVVGTDPLACGVCNGTITFTGAPTNATFQLNYNMNFTAQIPETVTSDAIGNVVFSGLCQNVYTNFELVDVSGCSSQLINDTIILSEPGGTIIDSIVNITDPSDCISCNGSFTIAGAENFTNYNVYYQLGTNPPSSVNVTSTFNGEIIITNLCEGDYSNIVIENSLVSGCFSNILGPITLSNPIIDLGIVLNGNADTICLGADITLEIQAFTPATTTIEWRYLDNNLNITPATPNMNPITLTPSANRCYYATMTDATTGCQDFDTVCVVISGNPILVADACFTLPEDSFVALSIINDIYGNDDMTNIYGSGNLNANLDITVIATTINGITTIDEVNDEIVYTPYSNFGGTDTLFYSVCNNDCPGFCDSSYVCFNITNVNDEPIAVDDINNSIVGVAVNGNVLTNDDLTDGIGATLTILQDGANGTIGSLSVTGEYTYTPNNPNFVGEDSIVYILCDNAGLCDTAVIYIEIIEHLILGNNEPIANPDVIVTTYDGTTPIIANLLNNDFDTDGDTISITQLTAPDSGMVTIDMNGNMTYTPFNPDFEGDDSFEYYICDDGMPMLCDTTTVYITIEPIGNPDINHIPTAVDDANYTYVDQATSGDVSLNDYDVDGDILTYTLDDLPANGTVVFNPDGTYTYTPNAGYEGPDNFTYTVCDNGVPVLCDIATVYITVVLDNLPPLAIDDINGTYVNIPVDGDVSTNDSEPEGDALTFSELPGTLSGGSLIFNSDGTYEFTPPLDATGDFTFEYIACDDGTPVFCDTAEVVISVEVYDVTYGVNNNPVANDDNLISTPNIPVVISVLANDFDIDGDSISISEIINPDGWLIIVSADSNQVAFIPPAGASGEYTFEYVICDNQSPELCDTAEVTIIILPENLDNQPPFAVDDANATVINTAVSGSVWDNDILPNDGDAHSVTLLDLPSNGTVVFNADSTYTYTPDSGYYGSDNFTYVLCDNGTPIGCDTATVYILIYNSNNPPVAVNDVNTTFNDLPVSGNVATNDFDIDNDSLTFSLLDDVLNGVLEFNDDGTYTYTPDPGFEGTETFTYIVCDDDNPILCDTAIVTIDVSDFDPGNNNDPVAVDDNVVINGDETNPDDVIIDILANDFDPDGDSLTVTLDTTMGPNNGTIVVNPDGTITYTPNPGFVGEDVFTYTICDEFGNCDEATVTITVLPPSDDNNLFAVDDSYVTNQDVAFTSGDVTTNDVNPNSSTLTTVLVTSPTNGTVTLNTDGTFVYTPNTGFAGVDQFTYILCDDLGNCDEATVIITVIPDDVDAVDDFVPVLNDDPSIIDILANDTYTTGEPIIIISEYPINGSIVVNEDGTITYTPDSDDLLPDSFQYVLCVNTICDTAWVNIEGPDLFIPTGISPNFDGDNDNFVIEDLLLFYPNAELSIFNRWGDEVWNSAGSYQNDWSGDNMEGKNLVDGTYFIILDYNDGIKKPYSGFVIVYRAK